MDPNTFSLDAFEAFVRQQEESSNTRPENIDNPSTSRRMSNNNSEQLLKTINSLVEQNARMLSMLQLRNEQTQEHVVEKPIKNFNIMPDLSKAIDQFTGDPRVAEKWIRSIENTACLHEWPDAFTFQTAKSHLQGAAKLWFSGRSDKITNWQAFREAFKKSFIFERSQSDLWKKMTERMQSPRENVALYFHKNLLYVETLN